MGLIQNAGTLGEYSSGFGSKLCDSGLSLLGESEPEQQIHIPQPLGLGLSLFQTKPLVRTLENLILPWYGYVFIIAAAFVYLSYSLVWKAKS